MKQNKLKFHSRITDVHLHDVMQICISKMEPNVNSLAEQRQAQFSWEKESLGYSNCIVQFCVGYGRDI
jgi:hypothetical protein